MRFAPGAIVRTPGGPYMSVLRDESGGQVTCGWVKKGQVHIVTLPESVLEPVYALGNDEAAFLQAYRDGATVLAHFSHHNKS